MDDFRVCPLRMAAQDNAGKPVDDMVQAGHDGSVTAQVAYMELACVCRRCAWYINQMCAVAWIAGAYVGDIDTT